MRIILLGLIGAVLVGCTQMEARQPVAKLKDGELVLPADYKSWPKFLSEIQRPDAKQVREIYVNPQGQSAKEGGSFPNGTVFVMENYKAQVGADGTSAKASDGKLMKGELARVFVMGKGEGWGESAPEGFRTGDWVYTSYDPGGKKTADNLGTCRACHLPLDKKDFVHRYDEYFQKRGQSSSRY